MQVWFCPHQVPYWWSVIISNHVQSVDTVSVAFGHTILICTKLSFMYLLFFMNLCADNCISSSSTRDCWLYAIVNEHFLDWNVGQYFDMHILSRLLYDLGSCKMALVQSKMRVQVWIRTYYLLSERKQFVTIILKICCRFNSPCCQSSTGRKHYWLLCSSWRKDPLHGS